MPFTLDMLYQVQKNKFFSILKGSYWQNLVYRQGYNAFHIFLYRKFNAFYFLILNQQIL